MNWDFFRERKKRHNSQFRSSDINWYIIGIPQFPSIFFAVCLRLLLAPSPLFMSQSSQPMRAKKLDCVDDLKPFGLHLHLSSDLECSLSYCKYDFDLSISSVKNSSSYPS